MPTLGGSVFAHNAIKFDYCIEAAIESLCELCDQVVAMDAESDDETLEVMLACRRRHPNLRVITGAKWECHHRYERLSILANQAKNFLDVDWHFMLQADEVIHEKSFAAIREAINNKKGFDSFHCRRINLFGDVNHYIPFDAPQSVKPVSDKVNRLARLHYDAYSDAESLSCNPHTCGVDRVDQIQIWHYGFVRDEAKHCDKIIDMQSWFHGEKSQPDFRAVECKNTTGRFDWTKFKNKSDIARIPWSHPKFAQKWVAATQASATIQVDE